MINLLELAVLVVLHVADGQLDITCQILPAY